MKSGEHSMLLGASGLPVLDMMLSMDYAFFWGFWYFYLLEQLEIKSRPILNGNK